MHRGIALNAGATLNFTRTTNMSFFEHRSHPQSTILKHRHHVPTTSDSAAVGKTDAKTKKEIGEERGLEDKDGEGDDDVSDLQTAVLIQMDIEIDKTKLRT